MTKYHSLSCLHVYTRRTFHTTVCQRVCLDFDCYSDTRILISKMLTLTTKTARSKQQEKNIVPNPDPKALKEKEIKKSFLQAVASEMKNNKLEKKRSTGPQLVLFN